MPINPSRIARLRDLMRPITPPTSSKRERVLELVFSVGSSTFSQRIQDAIAGVLDHAEDKPIPAVVFAAGRAVFSEPVRQAISRVLVNPGDIDGLVELSLVVPEQLFGTENDVLTDFGNALVGVGVDVDAVLLAQDVSIAGHKVVRIIVRSAQDDNPAAIVPQLLIVIGQTWPEIQKDIEELSS